MNLHEYFDEKIDEVKDDLKKQSAQQHKELYAIAEKQSVYAEKTHQEAQRSADYQRQILLSQDRQEAIHLLDADNRALRTGLTALSYQAANSALKTKNEFEWRHKAWEEWQTRVKSHLTDDINAIAAHSDLLEEIANKQKSLNYKGVGCGAALVVVFTGIALTYGVFFFLTGLIEGVDPAFVDMISKNLGLGDLLVSRKAHFVASGIVACVVMFGLAMVMRKFKSRSERRRNLPLEIELADLREQFAREEKSLSHRSELRRKEFGVDPLRVKNPYVIPPELVDYIVAISQWHFDYVEKNFVNATREQILNPPRPIDVQTVLPNPTLPYELRDRFKNSNL